MKYKTLFWVMMYITSVLCYLPYGISLAVGTFAAVRLVYGNAQAEAVERPSRGATRLSPVAATLLCLFPQVVGLASSLMPSGFNEVTSFMLSDGRAFAYPGPLFLLLPIMPVVAVWYLYGLRVAQRRLFEPKVCWVALLTMLCAFPLVYNWNDVARSSSIDNPWRSIHLGVKSFYYNGLWEELHYRFLLVPMFCGYFKRNFSIVLAALLFTLSHIDLLATFLAVPSSSSLMALLGIFLLGLVSGHCFCVTRSIIPCVVYHGLCSGSTYLVSGIGRLLLQP